MKIVIDTEGVGPSENDGPGRLSVIGKVVAPIEMNGKLKKEKK